MARKQHLPRQLEAARRRFEAWRKTRTRLGPIPEKLWESAAKLARTHGLNPVAQALRLNYYDLRRRLEDASESGASEPTEPTFVQVEANGALFGQDCVVELENGTGAKMTVRLASGGSRELVALAEAFWRNGP